MWNQPVDAGLATPQATDTTDPWAKGPAVLGRVTAGVGRVPVEISKLGLESPETSQLPLPSTYQTRTTHPVPVGWVTVQSEPIGTRAARCLAV